MPWRITLAPVAPLTLRLRHFRERAGLSQAELARQSGIAQSTISRIEAGLRRDVGLETIKKLARALQVSPRSLLAP